MDSPDLTEAVQVVYENGGWMWTSVLSRTEDNEKWADDSWVEDIVGLINSLPSAKEVQLNSDLWVALSQAEIAGLIRTEGHTFSSQSESGIPLLTYHLTTEGFNVAHEREMMKQQQQTNENLAFFTFILMFAALLQAAAAMVQLRELGSSLIGLFGVLILSITVAFYNSGIVGWLTNKLSIN